MFKPALRVLSLIVVLSAVSWGTTILAPTGGAVNVTIFDPTGGTPGDEVYDIRGTGVGTIASTSPFGVLGNAIISGTDPYPSNRIQLYTPDMLQSVNVILNFGMAVFPDPSVLVVSAVASPVGPVTNPGLMGLVGSLGLQFLQSSVAPSAGGTTTTYALALITGFGSVPGDGTGTPEPGTWLLTVGGFSLAGVARFVRRRA